MKKQNVLLFLFFFFLTAFMFGQSNVKPNYTRPYFQSNIRVTDTVGVNNWLKFPNTIFKEESGDFTITNDFGLGQAYSFKLINGTTVGSIGMGIGQMNFNQTSFATTGTFIIDYASEQIPFLKFQDDGVGAFGFRTDLKITSPTANRIITFQNASGTVAFTSDIPSPSPTLYTSDGSLLEARTVTMGANPLTFGTTGLGFIKLEDFLGSPIFQISDGAGQPYIYLDGGSTVHSSFKESLAVGHILGGVGAKLDVRGTTRFTVTGAETNGNILQTDATGLTSWVIPESTLPSGSIIGTQTNVNGGNTTTTADVFDYAGGTTVMDNMFFNGLTAGDTYLVSFGTTVGVNISNGATNTAIATNNTFVPGSLRQFKTAPISTRGSMVYSNFPVTVGANGEIEIHWITVAPATSVGSFFGRNITITKLN